MRLRTPNDKTTRVIPTSGGVRNSVERKVGEHAKIA